MMGSVPGLKRALEATIFRFKALAEKHDFMDAFRIGTLKNRVYVERHESVDEDDEEYEEEEEEEDEDASDRLLCTHHPINSNIPTIYI